MKTKTNKGKKIIDDYKKSLDELIKFKRSSLAQIEDIPFLIRKWNFIDKFIAYMTGTPLPPTPYELVKIQVNKMFKERLEQLKLNAEVKINRVRTK